MTNADYCHQSFLIVDSRDASASKNWLLWIMTNYVNKSWHIYVICISILTCWKDEPILDAFCFHRDSLFPILEYGIIRGQHGLFFFVQKSFYFLIPNIWDLSFFLECICSFYWKECFYSKKPPFCYKNL